VTTLSTSFAGYAAYDDRRPRSVSVTSGVTASTRGPCWAGLALG
jgi:hypothetical protein